MSKTNLIYRATDLFFKLAQTQTSQLGELEKAIKGTGLFPVKPGEEKYDQSHPLHAKIVKILDDNNHAGQISVSCLVTNESKPTFVVKADTAQVASKIKALLDPFVPKVYAALKKIPPPQENMTVFIFTV